MKKRDDHSSARKSSQTLKPLSLSLERTVVLRRTASHGRRWPSRKRPQLEPTVQKLRAARQTGLSKRESREWQAEDGIRVRRWMLDDLLRDDG